jgi:Ca2+/Na+ antiporter
LPTVTTIVTVPPDTFQVQYWYFGVTVNLIILCVIVGYYMQNTNEQIGSDSFIFITLLGTFLGSLVALFMNVYPWEVPAVIFGLLIVYIVRFRG